MEAPLDVTVAVGTFGRRHWIDLAEARAIPSAAEQAPVVHRHGETLAEARNAALAEVETEWVIHLDADDQLEPGYVEAMATGSADLRGPSLRNVWRSGPDKPFMPNVWGHDHDCVAECLREGNWLVVGTCARVDLVRQVGGWEEFGWSEDWALWARCWVAGATIEAIPSAVYRAHRNRRGRNRASRSVALKWHREIELAIWGESRVSP